MPDSHPDSVARRLTAELARIRGELPGAELRRAADRIGDAAAVLRGIGSGHGGVDAALAELAEVRDRLTATLADLGTMTSALEDYAVHAIGVSPAGCPADGDGTRR